MAPEGGTSATDTRTKAVPQYLIISILTIFAIGSQYFSNLSYILNQGIIQNGLDISSRDLLLPSTLSNLTFAMGVPLGPVLTRRFGFRRNYLFLVLIFLLGSVTAACSEDLIILTIGKIIQGLSAGMIFLTILPASLRSYPNRIRNLFLFMIITGLFGASALGAIFGSVSLVMDAWRWLFLLNVLAAVLCLVIGFLGLPKQDQQHAHEYTPANKTAVILFLLMMAVLAIPLCNLIENGFASLYVWPFLTGAGVLFVLFVYVDLKSTAPLIPFRTLKPWKPFSGMLMAVISHVSLILAIAGINGFLRNDMNLPFRYLTHFYVWFFVGIVVTAVLKTVLYDKLGAGALGVIGSVAVIYVSLQWKVIGAGNSLASLYFQIACLGAGISMVLVSGALGTALAGDIHQASMRSVTLHSIRNFAGAVVSPVIGWFLTRQNAVNYEEIRGKLDANSPEFRWEMGKWIRHYLENGVPLAKAKSMAAYALVVNAKKSAILGAYQEVFTILLILALIMLGASFVKLATGKGRSLVQKQPQRS